MHHLVTRSRTRLILWSASTDVTPLNRPKWNTILDERKGKQDGQGQAQRGADHRRAETGGGGAEGRGCGSGMRCIQAHDLRLEVEVRRHGCERGAGGQAAAGRELAAEETGGRPESGQGHAAVGDPKKLAGLVERRAEVRRLIEEYPTSERRVCGLMEIPRMSYRYQSRRDDTALGERLLALAREKPRYGYRRLWVLLGRHRQRENRERVQHNRVWRGVVAVGMSLLPDASQAYATCHAPPAGADGAESGVGGGFRQRRRRQRAKAADFERGRQLHARMFSVGRGPLPAEPSRHARFDTDHPNTRCTCGDSERQWAGAQL